MIKEKVKNNGGDQNNNLNIMHDKNFNKKNKKVDNGKKNN